MPEIRDAAWWRAYRKTRTAEGRACVSGTTRHKPDLSTERNRRLRQRRKDAATMAESPPALNAAPSPHRPSGPIAAPAELAEAPHRPARLDDQKSERTTTARREDPAPPGKWVFEDD